MTPRLLRSPWAPPLLLIIIGLAVFGPHAPKAGLHLDDHAFHRLFTLGTPAEVWEMFRSYVPGRNLYILYFAALYKIFGPSPAGIHLVGLALDVLNALLLYGLLRRLKAPSGWPLLVAGLFLVWPNHAETHFWVSAVAMNLLSTTSLLLAFHMALWTAVPPWPRVLGTLLLYASAFFNYDQVFFMWVPFLYMLWKLAPEAGWRRAHGALFVVISLLMGASHALLRIFSPVSSGGRPVPRLANVFHEVGVSMKACLLPMRKLPAWDCLQSWAGGPIPTLALLVALSAAWIWALRALWEDSGAGARRDWTSWAVFGILWTFCAYLPNYLWFISPRHNYLPSIGFLLLPACAAAVLGRSRPWRVGLATLAFLVFGLGASASIGEGCGWARSAELYRRFQAEAVRIATPEADNLFLLEAPFSYFRAPAFLHPQDHNALLAQATGRPATEGDTHLCPTPTGAFYLNQADLFGPETFQWRPLRGLVALRYVPAGDSFSCVGSLVLLLPDGTPRTHPLDARAACPHVQALEVPLWLDSARKTSSNALPLLSSPFGADLLAARLEKASGGASRLVLLWRARRKLREDFAVKAAILSFSGERLWTAEQPESRARRSAHARIWPLYDDLLPPSTWKPGDVVREEYLLALDAPLPAGPLHLRLVFFERRRGAPWAKDSEAEVPLEIP